MQMDIARCWGVLEDIVRGDNSVDLSQVTWTDVSPTPELQEAVFLLTQPGMSAMLEEWVYEVIFESLSNYVNPRFWKIANKKPVDKSFETSQRLREDYVHDAFGWLYCVYVDKYMEAVRRVDWLKMLATLAPAKSQPSSAFAPVKSKNAARKGVQFMCPNSNQDSREASALIPEKDFEMGSEKRRHLSMDGSYIPGMSGVDNSLLSEASDSSIGHDTSFDNQQRNQDPHCGTNPSVTDIHSDAEDEESFIRSPIGGNKKFLSSSHCENSEGTPFPEPMFFNESPAPCASRNPSTPALMLPDTNNASPESSMVHEEASPTSSIALQESDHQFCCLFPFNILYHERSTLPEESDVFGQPVLDRPVNRKTDWDYENKPGNFGLRIQAMIKSVLFYTLPKEFSERLYGIYTRGFKNFKLDLDARINQTRLQDSVDCAMHAFGNLNLQLARMGLLDFIAVSPITKVLHYQLEKHIEDESKGNFDTSFCSDFDSWMDYNVYEFFKSVLRENTDWNRHSSFCVIMVKLQRFIDEKYGKLLISQFFDIIIDFPDSKPAIEDLKKILSKTDLRSELVSSLKNALESRLLHPGVNTAVILTAYISAIKSLRILEPAGVILELVCEPVGRYLRSREDTVRCIVASITDEGNNDLVNELVNTKPVSEEADDEDGIMDPRWELWMPDPVDADSSSGSKFRRQADILSTLVNIYGSKELFVNEYRALLADRILVQYNYDVERELRYLELLKLRFGEAQLHFCEVMLRDVSESRRVNARIQEASKTEREEGQGANGETGQSQQQELDLNAMILSAQFWPAFRDEKIKLPPELQCHLDKYTRSFEQQKQNRTLVWKPHLGVMNIDLEMKGETFSFSVSPVQAAIIMKFQERAQWSLVALSQELEMTPSVLRRKLAFWQGQGLLQESGSGATGADYMYTLVEEPVPSGSRGSAKDRRGAVDIEEEVESAMASAQQQKEEEMQILWTYIQGMLANLDCLTLERIHAMLRMFATEEPGSEISLQELKSFLDNKVKDQILIFSSGVYRLNK